RAGVGDGNQAVRVLNYNVDGERVSPATFLKLVDEVQPDIIACQEFSTRTDIIARGLSQRGWHIADKPEALFLASRFPIVSSTYLPTVEKWRNLVSFFVLQAPSGNINFVNVHLETPRWGLESLLQGRRSQVQPIVDNMARRRMESEQVSQRIKELH